MSRVLEGFTKLFIWYSKDLPDDERKLLKKLDCFVLIYVCLSMFTKSLDRSNLTNAYVTGMKEDLHFGKDDLSIASMIFSAGYVVSMCCGGFVVTRKWARLFLPVLEIVYGGLTMCAAATSNSKQIFGLRFLIGVTEGALYPSALFILGSWYKRFELCRRVMVFSVSSTLGSIASGLLQGGLVSLDTKAGLRSWQWMFIIDGLITVVIALLGTGIFIGGSIDQARSAKWLINEDELEVAARRMGVAYSKPSLKPSESHSSDGVENSSLEPEKSDSVSIVIHEIDTETSPTQRKPRLDFSVFKRIWGRWHVHYYSAFWVLLNLVALPNGTGFSLWLKSQPEKYSVSDVNYYSTIQSAVSIAAQFLLAGLLDTFSTYPFLTLVQSILLVCYISLAIWNIPFAYKWVCHLTIGIVNVNQVILGTQCNHSCRRDPQERAIVLGCSDAMSHLMLIWETIAFFPTSLAPEFKRGYIVAAAATGVMLILPVLGYCGDLYDNRKYGDYNSSQDEGLEQLEQIDQLEQLEKPSTSSIPEGFSGTDDKMAGGTVIRVKTANSYS